jgi:hypothetical protein
MTPSPAKRKRKRSVKPGRSSNSSPVNGTARRVRTTKAAASFKANTKYVGSRIAKNFHGIIHFGTVKKYLSSANPRWAIRYDDGDVEDMNQRQLEKATELYERKKREDVGSEDDNGWDFGEGPELDCLSLLSLQKPIALPEIALEETIEFLWEKGVPPFEYSENRADVVDDWDDYQIFYWHEGAGGGTAVVSHRLHPEVKVGVKWRPAHGRRRRKVSEQGLLVR